MTGYMKPDEAAEELGISRSTITRLKQMGMPVQYLGTCGRKYLIDPQVCMDFMQALGEKDRQEHARKMSVMELRAKRHQMVG